MTRKRKLLSLETVLQRRYPIGSTHIHTQPCVHTGHGVKHVYACDSSMYISKLLPTLHTEDPQLPISRYM